MPGGHIRGLRMSLNYDFELLESIDRAVYVLGKKKLRSDDYEILSIYSGDEGAAIEGLKVWSANKGSYFDRKSREWRPRTDFAMINGHAVIDIIHVYEDKEAEVQRERFVKQRKQRTQRKGGFY